MTLSRKVIMTSAYIIITINTIIILFVKYHSKNTMVLNPWDGSTVSGSKYSKESATLNMKNELNINMRSSNSEIQGFKLLCLFTTTRNGKSVCEDRDEETIANIINKVYLDPPSTHPYRFRVDPPVINGQIGVPKIVDSLLGGKQGGFYIESGGYNGEDLSNSLFFELKRSFRGILVEPNVLNYKKLLRVNRKAYSINACYSTTGLPTLVDFVNAKALGAIQEINQKMKLLKSLPKKIQKDNWQGNSKALCLSFYSILLAVGNPVVDYLSLDIEGAELPVLKSIPWDKVNINVLSIECGQIERCNRIGVFMKNVGYRLTHHVPSASNPQDIILVKK